MQTAHDELRRKNYMVSDSNIDKVDNIAKQAGLSSSAVIRLAIEAYEPQSANDLDTPELIELVSDRLKEAIESTRQANHKVAATLQTLENMESHQHG
jgi:hypothetical protein